MQERGVLDLQAYLRERFADSTDSCVEANLDNTVEWNARLVASPKLLLEIQRRADEIEAGVRAQFGLPPRGS